MYNAIFLMNYYAYGDFQGAFISIHALITLLTSFRSKRLVPATRDAKIKDMTFSYWPNPSTDLTNLKF